MDKSIGRMITLLSRKCQSYLSRELNKYNLTSAEQPFFMVLQRCEGITQDDLTAMVCVDKSATARAVKSLEEKGFLIRVQDQNNRRQNRIYPTEKAKQMGEDVRKELLHFNDLLIQGILPQTTEDVYFALQKMERNLEDILGEKNSINNKEKHNETDGQTGANL